MSPRSVGKVIWAISGTTNTQNFPKRSERDVGGAREVLQASDKEDSDVVVRSLADSGKEDIH